MAAISESSFPSAPPAATDTRAVCPACLSRTKISRVLLVSLITRLLAYEVKATYRQSAEMDGPRGKGSAGAPSDATETRLVVPVCRSRTNTSYATFVSPVTRLLANDVNATYRLSAESDGSNEKSFPCAPPEDTEMRLVCPV